MYETVAKDVRTLRDRNVQIVVLTHIVNSIMADVVRAAVQCYPRG